MKLTLAFLLLIGAMFQNTQSAEITIDSPTIDTSYFPSTSNLKYWANNAINKATNGISWINGHLAALRNQINSASAEIQNEATYTETQITKTEESLTLAVDD